MGIMGGGGSVGWKEFKDPNWAVLRKLCGDVIKAVGPTRCKLGCCISEGPGRERVTYLNGKKGGEFCEENL